MSESAKLKKLHELVGIDDLAEFYRARYASNQLLDARYFHALDRFDIAWARTMWVYDNVRPGARVLDLGCGSGVLALLKRKRVTLVGVDLSPDCADAARRNGYDEAQAANFLNLPFDDATFDYVVSLDVMGHVEFDEKDAVLTEMRRVLKPDGVNMHGIEVMNSERRKDYDQMNHEELLRFVGVDGHVGMESAAAIRERFSRFFKHVQIEPRYSICQSAEELVKQMDEYGAQLCDADLLDYLRGLSFAERRAFNMAMGYVFNEIDAQKVHEPKEKSEYLFLKASQAPLGSFYGEHYDRGDLFPQPVNLRAGETAELNESTSAEFDSGWYEAENFPPIGRWMGRHAKIGFTSTPFSRISFEVTTHIPDVDARPLRLEFRLNGERLKQVSLNQSGWQRIELTVADNTRSSGSGSKNQPTAYQFDIRADRTWRPRSTNSKSTDDRELSIAVCNLIISA
jgi:ubiquinone/menaquinone biosynthesis C-methylase UbiE